MISFRCLDNGMKRYKFLDKDDIYEALNRLRDAFLAARDGNEVEEIINGLLTEDERLKIGRRIIVAQYVRSGMGIDQIVNILKVGKNTVIQVAKALDKNPVFLDLVDRRMKTVEREYNSKKYRFEGSSYMVFKKKVYTGFKRKDVSR